MNPVLIILILMGGGLLWLLCSSLFKPIGGAAEKILNNTKNAMSSDSETIKETEEAVDNAR